MASHEIDLITSNIIPLNFEQNCKNSDKKRENEKNKHRFKFYFIRMLNY